MEVDLHESWAHLPWECPCTGLCVPRTHLGRAPWHTRGGCCADGGRPPHGDVQRWGQLWLFAQAGAHLLTGCVRAAQRAVGPLGTAVQSHKGVCMCGHTCVCECVRVHAGKCTCPVHEGMCLWGGVHPVGSGGCWDVRAHWRQGGAMTVTRVPWWWGSRALVCQGALGTMVRRCWGNGMSQCPGIRVTGCWGDRMQGCCGARVMACWGDRVPC